MSVKKIKKDQQPAPSQEEPKLMNNAHYIKDFSFENPGVLKNISAEEGPNININIHVDVTPLAEDVYEVVILLNIKADSKGEVLFLVELSYGGIFRIKSGLDEKEQKQLLLVDAPTLLFPFARTIVANTTREGGLPPLLLNPVDFQKLSQQAVNKESKVKH